MNWSTPTLPKIYEALGCIVDGRLEVEGDSAKCYSSSRGKFYSITFDPKTNAIMLNDNTSYWKGELGYPGIAYLMQRGLLPYEQKYAEALKDIPWKDVNTKYKNDFDKTARHVEEIAEKRGVTSKELQTFADLVIKTIDARPFGMLGKKQRPPSGY